MNSDAPVAEITAEQCARLTALLDTLGSFPVAETIVRCLEAERVNIRVEADRLRIDAAMAGAWAFSRMLLYLDRLRSLNEERMQIGDEIRLLKRHPYPSTEAEVEGAAWARVSAPHLAGKQELVIHFFSVSIQHIRSLLLVTAAAVDHEIPQDDLDYLEEYRYLRNHFEHWYDRLPGKTNEAGLMTKTLTADEYRVRGGLQIDEKDCVIVVEPKKSGPVTHVVDVTNDGVARVEKIVQKTATNVKDVAIERVRRYYIANPQDIPPPQTIRDDSLISVGGYEPGSDST